MRKWPAKTLRWLVAYPGASRRSALLAVIFALAVLLPVYYLAGQWYEARLLAERRAQVLASLAPYATAATSALHERLDLLEALRAFVSLGLPPDTIGTQFEIYASALTAEVSGVDYVALAPGGIQRYLYVAASDEQDEHERERGRDAAHDARPHVAEDVRRTIESRQIALSDPRDLEQDSSEQEWVGWLAVYIGNSYWGLVSVRLDLMEVLTDAKQGGLPYGVEVAYRDEEGHVFHGREVVFEAANPVTYPVDVHDIHWVLAAIPAQGWRESYRGALMSFQAFGIALVALLAILAYRMVNRQTVLAAMVREGSHEISKMSSDLERGMVERRLAEVALREAQRLLSTLMSNLPGMAYRSGEDRNRSMQIVSEGSLELTGYPPAKLLENGDVCYGQLIHPADQTRVWEGILQAAEARRPFHLTYRILTAEGVLKWVMEQGRAVLSSDGKTQAIEGFISDVTDRTLAHQILEQRMAERTRQLTALSEVTAVASESPDLGTILDHSLDQILAVVGGRVGFIMLLDEGGTALQLAASRGLQSDALARLTELSLRSTSVEVPDGDDLPLREASAGQSQLKRGLLWTAQQCEDCRPGAHGNGKGWPAPLGPPATCRLLQATDGLALSASGVDAAPTQASATACVRAKGTAVGLLGVVRDQDRPFNGEELALLAAIGGQVGVAVENARLVAAAQDKAALEERQRLARELHDSTTQLLYGITLMAETGRRQAVAAKVMPLDDLLARLGTIAQQALKEMRLLVYELRPSNLKREGLVAALQQRLDLVEKRAGVETRLEVEGTAELPPLVEEGLHGVVQEALNNALKHASASAIVVRLHVEATRAVVEVRDNGCGFDLRSAADRGGLGLANMKERADRLGGRLAVSSRPNYGTTVRFDIEVPRGIHEKV